MSWLQRVRFAIRKLLNRPAFALATITCLSLGIGAMTGIFSVINHLLLSPTAVGGLGELEFVMAMREDVEPYGVSPIEINAYSTQARSFSAFAIAQRQGDSNLMGDTGAERVSAAKVSREFLEVLRVAPSLGRNFSPEEDQPSGPKVILISHGLWQAAFGSEKSILGSPIRLDGDDYLVVGILPPGFDLPAKNDVLFPLQFDFERTPIEDRSSHSFMLIGRRHTDRTEAVAEADLKAIAAKLQKESPETNSGWGVALVPYRDLLLGDLRGRIRGMVYVLAGAVFFLLLISCLNAAHLFLVRSLEQEQELALSSALGASRRELLLQLLVEGGVIALAAGALGSLLSFWIVPRILAAAPIQDQAFTARFASIDVELPVLGFALAVSLATVFVFGSIPALRLIRVDLNRLLRSGTPGAGGSATSALSAALVATEVAVSVLLLVGAGLLAQSFQRLSDLDLGFDSRGLVALDFTLYAKEFPDHASRVDFVTRVLESVRAMPQVEAAGTTTDVPLRWGTWDQGYVVEGATIDLAEVNMTAHRMVSDGYLETLGLKLVKGRSFEPRDRVGADPVVVVSEELARRAWPGEDPIGKRIRQDEGEPYRWMTVVGMVADVREDRYNYRVDRPVWYLPYAQTDGDYDGVSLVIRTRADAAQVVSQARRELASVFPEVAPSESTDLRALAAGVIGAERVGTYVAILLGSIGMLLAAVGLYGVLAYTVAQKKRELGIRLALGGSPQHVKRLIVRRGLWLTGLGLAVGIPASVLFGQFLSSLLFEIDAFDPATLLVVSLALVAVSWIACYFPARRAVNADPISALRQD